MRGGPTRLPGWVGHAIPTSRNSDQDPAKGGMALGFFRFRRSFRIAPGVRVNLSKSGLSTSIGRSGATVNVRGDRVRGTVGIPGSGLSYQEQARVRDGGGSLVWLALIILVVVYCLV